MSSHNFTTDPLEEPAAGGLPKNYPKHVEDIVDSISKLNLLEVSSLNSLLKVSKYIFLCGKLWWLKAYFQKWNFRLIFKIFFFSSFRKGWELRMFLWCQWVGLFLHRLLYQRLVALYLFFLSLIMTIFFIFESVKNSWSLINTVNDTECIHMLIKFKKIEWREYISRQWQWQ